MSDATNSGGTLPQTGLSVSRRLIAAVLCIGFSMVTVLLFLIAESPYTMFLFALIGQPAFAVGVALYVWEVFMTLRAHRQV